MRLSQKSGRRLDWKCNLLAFLIPFLGMLIVMAACGLKPFGKSAMLYSDNYHQYYPFFVAFRRTLREGGSLLYSWDVGMGVDYLGMIAYYLGSPLNWLSALVPESQVLNYYCMLVPFRLGMASLFFSLFLKHAFQRDDLSIALFGAFYGLCAWALGYQWNIMWQDTFALLPIVMLGMLQLLRDRKFVLYTLALFLSVFSNYYIGLFTCFFVFLTFFCYEICRFQGWKRFFGDLFCIGVFSVLAIGMTCVLSLTTLAALQTTQSSVNKFPTGFRLNMASSHDFLGLLGAMRQVAGNMGGGLEPTFKEGFPNLYCGVGTILLAFLFLLSDEVKLRDKLCSLFLLLFFIVSFIIRQLDYIWHGFHFPNMIPYRFSFLYSFVMLYMAYRAWINRRKMDILQVLAALFLTAAVLCCSANLMETHSATIFGQKITAHVYLIYNAGFLLAYSIILICACWNFKPRNDTEEELLRLKHTSRRRRRRCRGAVFTVILLEVAATLTNFACFFPATNLTGYPKGGEEAASMIRYMHEREDELFYRAETAHSQTLNDGALNGYSGISAFTSSANVHITEFMRALGYGAKNTYNRYCFEESSPVSNLFLDLKYMLDRDGRDRNSTYFSEVHHFGRVGLYQNTAYLPLGFLAEPELAQVDFLNTTGSFPFQNALFSAATGVKEDVWTEIEKEYCDVYGSGVTVSPVSDNGYCTYSEPLAGSNVIYSYVANQDGFACVRLELPKRNDFYISVNGNELYKENYSIPQMLAIQDVRAGDIIDIRIVCKEGENGTATVNVAILDEELFFQGYDVLKQSTMELTSFSDTLVEGTIHCERDGLLYTSIPQNGNWKAYADGEAAEIILIGDCMVGLNLTEGDHTLRFVYDNAAFKLGAAISAVSTLVFLLIVLISRLWQSKKPPEEMPDMPVFELEEAESQLEEPQTDTPDSPNEEIPAKLPELEEIPDESQPEAESQADTNTN